MTGLPAKSFREAARRAVAMGREAGLAVVVRLQEASQQTH